MSYDIYLRAPTCDKCGRAGSEPSRLDPTYNLSPIFDLALTGEQFPNAAVPEVAVVLFHEKTDRRRGLRVLSGKVAKDTLADIDAAIGRLQDPAMRDQFVALEPENGWGDLAGALWVLKKMREYVELYPNNVWDIH